MWSLIFASCMVLVLSEPVHIHYDTTSYHGPPAPLDKVGRVVDTPEVAHAKAAHFHAYHAEAAKASHHSHEPSYEHGGHEHHEHHAAPVVSHHHQHHVYHGPPAPLAHDGRVVDTPEVAHAKSAHFHAYQEELAKVKSHHSAGPNGFF